MLVKSLALK